MNADNAPAAPDINTPREKNTPLVYLVIGPAGSGRRALLADIIAGGLGADEHALVLLSKDESDNAPDAGLRAAGGCVARWGWLERGGGPDGPGGRIETGDTGAGGAGGATHVFFVADGRRNPVDQIEAFKPWLQAFGGELARVMCVVDCALGSQHRELLAWLDACVHFSDIVLLARREGAPGKWVSDFQARYKDRFYPCLFEFVKGGVVRNPLLVLVPETRRMSHYFDEPSYELAGGGGIEEGFDDDDAPAKRKSDDRIEVVEETDEFLARRAGGRRVREIPDIARYLGGSPGSSSPTSARAS